MVLRIRLARWGTKHSPFYGIVVAHGHVARDGKHLERLGTYNSVPDENNIKRVQLDTDRVKYWIGVGAQPSDRVAWLLAKANILPMPPIQLQRTGQMSLLDRSTWDIQVTDGSGVVQTLSASDAKKALSESDEWKARVQGIALAPTVFVSSNMRMNGKPPLVPLTNREALRVSKSLLWE